MNSGVRIGLGLGLAGVVFLIVLEGVGDIANLLSRAGWVLLWLVPLQIVTLSLDAVGWRLLILRRMPLTLLTLIACIRQAINRLLPVASVGGDLAGVRLLAQQGVEGASAAASVIVELMLGLIAQYLFVVLGVMCLFVRVNDTHLELALGVGLAAGLPPLVLMILVLRHGRVFARIAKFGKRLFGRWSANSQGLDQGDRLEAEVQTVLAAGTRPLQALSWQLAGYVVGCSETWLALRWLGHTVSATDALALESLAQGAKSLFFMVPAGLGVQELGLIGIGHLLGMTPDVALALSLAKRMREILLGIPSLVAWHWMEHRGVGRTPAA